MEQQILRPARRWHLSAGIVIPVALTMVAVMACVGGFVVWSTTNNDNRALERETKLIARFLADDLLNMVDNQRDSAFHYDIYRAAGENFDRGRIDRQLGRHFYDAFGYEQTYVVNGQDELVYAMRDGRELRPARTVEGADITPLVTRVREKIAEGQLTAYLDGESDQIPYSSEIMMIGGVPAEVTAVPITPEDSARIDPDAPFSIHVAVEYLDDVYAQFVARQYILENAALVTQPSGNPDKAAFPILNSAGRIVAFYEWQPDRPGRRMLAETVPALAAAVLVAAVLILLLLVRLWRYSAALEASHETAQFKALHDGLTGLPNRAKFEASLAQTLSKGGETGDFALMMLDLDRFKQVNDTLGHPAGDELIRLVGKRLQAVMGPTGLIARLGGDEFGVIDPSITTSAQANALAARLVETIGKPFDLFGDEASVGVSIGVILAAPRPDDGAELIRKADIALYEAKAAGRNRAVIYEPRMDELVQHRRVIEADLRESLRHTRQVSVSFEPVIDAATGNIVGAQAHPRWVHPEHGEVDPSVFLPVAESSGLMEMLGDHMLRRASHVGGHSPGAIISLAISPIQLRNPKFFNRVFDILADTGMRPANLEMLISEETVTGMNEATLDTLRKFHAAGIAITADDFGTGYSALDDLRRAFVGRVRLGPPDASENRAGIAILQAVGNLVRTMGMTIGAKAITTPEQMAAMTLIGCSTLQGPAIAARATAEVMQDLLARNSAISPAVTARVA
jgi:diguanylate cyclase (GGDEF)-like protein